MFHVKHCLLTAIKSVHTAKIKSTDQIHTKMWIRRDFSRRSWGESLEILAPNPGCERAILDLLAVAKVVSCDLLIDQACDCR
jgi:hypothetical protein